MNVKAEFPLRNNHNELPGNQLRETCQKLDAQWNDP